MTVRFGVLGVVGAWHDEVALDVGPAQQRRVLGALLMDAGRVVSGDALVERVWGERTPRRGREALYAYVSRLRRVLAPAGVDIVREQGGYRIAVEPEAVDAHRFRDLTGRAARADADERAVAYWEEALGLWRGEAFAGADTPWFNARRALLDAERTAARLDLTDVRLRTGQHARVLADCSARAEAHPLDERVIGQLMRALYGCGRQADALERYERARHDLAEELGIDPGAPLRRLHRQILTSDPALDPAPPATASAPTAPPTTASPTAAQLSPRPSRAAPAAREPSRPVPRQLPPAPATFVGRSTELAALDCLLKEPAGGERVLVISAIGGAGGIGKTWLALRWAHEHLDRFPDGQLYADLRGFDPTAEPLPAPAVVRGFLDALGTGPREMPADPEARAGLFRSLVADRRMLIVLDNARDADQIRPLLPGGSACMVVVTSRNHLGPLAITHGSRSLALDTLGDEEAREVLARAVGHDRTAAEPGAVAALLRRCAGLPLALGIVASRAAARPDFPLTALAEELDDATGRLDALNAGDLTTDLRAVFDTSHRALDEPAAEVFALLGLAPGPDIDLFAAAALTALPPPRARIVLRALETAHLVQQHTPGRYRMHDLVRLYAAERGHARPPEVRVAARRRLVDFHLHTARTADRLLFPHRPPIEVDPPSPGCTPRPLEESTAARWFDDERLCLLAAQELALDEGWDRRAWQLAWTADLHHRHRGHVLDGLATWRAGLTAAERLGDPAARATAHWLQGRTRSDLGEYALALDHLRRAQKLFRQVRDRPGEAHAHRTIARTLAQQGEHRRALVHARQALDLYRTLDNTVWEANALNAVGWYLAQLGDHEQAHSCCARALALFREEDYRVGEASALDSLGFIAHRTGLHAEALDHYRHALRLCRETDNDQQAADALYSLGAVHRALGRDADARHSWRQALALYRDQHRTAKAQRIRDQLDALDRASAG